MKLLYNNEGIYLPVPWLGPEVLIIISQSSILAKSSAWPGKTQSPHVAED